ncbi:hypothetical protein TNCV_4972161 [Trichonephila clavipes]|nr:hypothetical protein TNCV_4972161 [Trichonephila clavipes]
MLPIVINNLPVYSSRPLHGRRLNSHRNSVAVLNPESWEAIHRSKREIRRSPNVSFNKLIVARVVPQSIMLRRLVGTTAPGHHDCSIQE